MGPTETLAQFVVDTRLRDIPPKAVEISKLVILDVLGVTLAASRQADSADTESNTCAKRRRRRERRVIGSRSRTEPALAAWANGALAFALDFDDNIHGSTHTVPAALAIGEGNGASGATLLEAYILGRDICFRLDAALDAGRRKNQGGPTSRGWFAGGTTGSLAAAAAAGKVLRVKCQTDGDRVRHRRRRRRRRQAELRHHGQGAANRQRRAQWRHRGAAGARKASAPIRPYSKRRWVLPARFASKANATGMR